MGGQWEGRVRLVAGTACGATGRLDLFREVQRRTKGGGLRLSQLLWGGPTGFSLQWRQGWLWGQQQSGWWVREGLGQSRGQILPPPPACLPFL